jgi:hypothetical protein
VLVSCLLRNTKSNPGIPDSVTTSEVSTSCQTDALELSIYPQTQSVSAILRSYPQKYELKKDGRHAPCIQSASKHKSDCVTHQRQSLLSTLPPHVAWIRRVVTIACQTVSPRFDLGWCCTSVVMVRPLLGLSCALVAGIMSAAPAYATPSVSVSMSAAFSAPPYLIELM